LLQQAQVEVLLWSSLEAFMTAASDTFKEIVAPPPVRAESTIFGPRQELRTSSLVRSQARLLLEESMTLKLWLEHLGLELPPASTLSEGLAENPSKNQ
jgi:hypothetical protein